MKIKDILLFLTSYPTPTHRRAVEDAVALAEGLGAQIRAIAFEVDVQSPLGLYVDSAGVSGILAADRCAHDASDLLEHFEKVVTARGVAHDHSPLVCRLHQIPERLVAEAQFCDLAIVPLRPMETVERDIAEGLIFGCGRPVLVFPQDLKRDLPTSLKNVALAWDNSRPATRAIADALPFLQQAKEVRVFTVVGDNSVHALRSLAKLAKHLARHGVEIVSEDVKCNGRAIGDVFSAYVLEHKINLLVMGAYGHSRFREFILGGATESMLDRPPSWILLSH